MPNQLSLQQAFVTIQNTKIRYLHSHPGSVVGNSLAEPTGREVTRDNIFFIHGLGSSSERWLDIPDALYLAGFNTYAIDLPGFGASQIRSETMYSVDYLVDVTYDFIRTIGLAREKTTIVGHSLGGFVAARLVSKFRAANTLVLVDSSGLLKHPTPLLERYFSAAMNPSGETVRAVFEEMVADPVRIPDILVQGFIMRMAQENAKHAFSTAYESSTSTQLSQPEFEVLQSLGESAFVIWGEKDRLIPLEFFSGFCHSLPRARTALVTDAGHAPFAEKPALLFELVRSFLSKSS